MPSCCTLVGRCETDCAPSINVRAPARCARSTISLVGVTVPSAFDTCVTETSLVLSFSKLSVFLEQNLAVVVDRDDANLHAGLGRQHLPRHDVRVMFEVRNHELVAGPQVLLFPTSAQRD